MDALRLDLRYALRVWRRQPATTAVAIIALALGIGANTVVFSFVSAMLLRPLPYADPDRLVMMWQDRSAVGGPRREVISPGLFVDWRTRATALQGVAAVSGWGPNLTGEDQNGNAEPERLAGATVSAAYFATLGVAPAYGRTFAPEDDRPGAPTRVVLGDGLWRRRLGGRPDIVGRSIQLDGQPAEVIGVMPASFHGAVIDADIWDTIRIDPANAPRGLVMLRAIGRIAPAVTFDQAQAAIASLQTQLQAEDAELAGASARVVRLQDDMVGPVRPILIVLSASVALVLLIACANVTSILLARASERRTEMAVRVAIGADRRRVVRQLLAESGLLAAAGALGGLVLAYFGVRLLVAQAPAQLPRLTDVHLDVQALAFTGAIAALAAVAAGLVPAAAAWRAALMSDLREGAREAAGFTRSQSLIVIAEVAAAMTLAVAAALFVRSLVALEHVDLGFRPDHVLTASVALPRGTYRGDEALRDLFGRMIDRASRIPGVASAATTSVLPLSGAQIMFNFRIEGRPPGRTPAEEPVASFRSVGADFFSTFGMRIVEGRGFTPDDRAGAPIVAVANQALVRRYFPGASPIGHVIGINGNDARIVGVVADVHHAGPAVPPDGEMYVPYPQLPTRAGWLVLRTTGDPAALAPLVRQAMRGVDPNLPLASVRPMAALVESSVAQPRFLAELLTGFSGVAAALALVGVYGLLEFSVSRRTREIGVRMALGASRRAVVALVLRQSLTVVLTGVVIGAVAGAGATTIARSLLFDVQPGDPRTLVAMGLLTIAASALASFVPARRAASVNAVVALRDR